MVTSNYFVKVDWDNAGTYVGTYDDISSDVLSVTFKRGRNYASQLTGNSTAGVLTATLNNTSGKYSPSNASSVLTGKLTPGRRVQLSINSGSFPYTFPFIFSEAPMWTGRLSAIMPTPASTALHTATLTAEGVLGYLNDFVPITEMQTSIRTDQAVGEVLDALDWPSADRDLATGQTTMVRWWTDSAKTIDALLTVEETENGFVKETADGSVGFESRHTRLASPYDTSNATFSDASDATNTYTTLQQLDPLSTVINTFRAKARKYTEGSVATLWTSPETGSDSPSLVTGESKTFIASYPNSNSDNNAIGVGTWTTPVASTDYVANTASDGSGTNKTSDITVTQTKVANEMIMTFANGSTDTVYLTTLQARGTSLSESNNVTVSATDTSSITKYGERKFVAKSGFFPSSSEAQSWANYQLQMHGTPVDILTMSFSANVSSANMTQALEREISDRITVVANTNAVLGISADFFIEAIAHNITQGGTKHDVTYQLSPVNEGYTQFWILGTGVLGTSTVPAY